MDSGGRSQTRDPDDQARTGARRPRAIPHSQEIGYAAGKQPFRRNPENCPSWVDPRLWRAETHWGRGQQGRVSLYTLPSRGSGGPLPDVLPKRNHDQPHAQSNRTS
jgi:hypothetical protein